MSTTGKGFGPEDIAITFTFMHLADTFIQSDLQCIPAIHVFFITMCVPWESNPQPFALLTQCSTTEPQEHYMIFRLEVPDLYLCSYYFSYFAFNVNKHVQTIYLLLWIYFDVNYIYLQIHHHHHVDMLCYYKTLTTYMSSNIFNCCVYRVAADTY